jgi:hypothetical protein
LILLRTQTLFMRRLDKGLPALIEGIAITVAYDGLTLEV